MERPQPLRLTTGSLERLAPQSQAWQAWTHRDPSRLVRTKDAYIVADDAVTAIVKPGGKRRFARSRGSHEGERAPADDDGIGVERQHSRLMDQHAHGRTKQEKPNVARRRRRNGIDDDASAAADDETRHAGDRDPYPAVGRLRLISRVGKRRDRAHHNPHIRLPLVRIGGGEFGEFELAGDGQPEQAVAVIGHRAPGNTATE